MQLVKNIKYLEEVAYRGKNALRLLMDEKMPTIDILVRESIQNSLDAAKNGSRSISVDFNYADFDAKNLRGILDNETCNRLDKIQSGVGLSLYIRDVGTNGLSGPISHRELKQGEKEGNYLKLCFAMGSPQDQEAAGGSWGFGKTIFFRACRSPVLFYSRFQDGNRYVERLIFYLIEDADEPNALTRTLVPPASTGFAWWGECFDNKILKPCENSEQIGQILEQIGCVPRFCGNETGTLIFMPCLNTAGQVPTICESNTENFAPPFWMPRGRTPNKKDFEEYTNIAIQRWYAPRLANERFAERQKPFLLASVGGNQIGSVKYPILPLFRLIRDFYDYAIGMRVPNPKVTEPIAIADIELNSTFIDKKNSAGTMVAIRLPRESPLLEMVPPNNHPSPIVQACNTELGEPNNPAPLIALMRSPGMIVAYEHSGRWVPTTKDSDGHHLLALFVLRSDAKLNENFTHPILEEEIRQKEPPAHNRWVSNLGKNGQSLNLVERIQKNLIRKIEEKIYPHPVLPVQKDFHLATEIAKILLPPGFGNAPTKVIAPPTREGSKKSHGQIPKIQITETVFTSLDTIEFEFEIYSGDSNTVELSTNVGSESSPIPPNDWINDVGTPFPFEFLACVATKLHEDKNPAHASRWKEIYITSNTQQRRCHRLLFRFPSPRSKAKCRVTLKILIRNVLPMFIVKHQIHPSQAPNLTPTSNLSIVALPENY